MLLCDFRADLGAVAAEQGVRRTGSWPWPRARRGTAAATTHARRRRAHHPATMPARWRASSRAISTPTTWRPRGIPRRYEAGARRSFATCRRVPADATPANRCASTGIFPAPARDTTIPAFRIFRNSWKPRYVGRLWALVGRFDAPRIRHGQAGTGSGSTQMDFIEAARAIVGPAHVLTGAETARYATDWTGKYAAAPLCVLRPADTAEVSALIAAGARHRRRRSSRSAATPVSPAAAMRRGRRCSRSSG